ncbi:helix-turn-helix domain-containing protein [Pseudodonghicola flavimaris]|uniref:Helix-turn-helix domain-containing protein n=1 Tax=Pseudodonghicola flavimaris TaxID=3050036 RepID=A0ABT7EW07_9RHOB|nr:helix-turn-helix domain-containing protein [Pseudodonghicola flavimaris]MDK3016503.1 helix-turn-helix domain-containing protein [Pseudodonghicola flavimaris]
MAQLLLGSPAQHAEMIEEAARSSQPGRSVIAASWRRSLLHHRLDPKTLTRPPRLEQPLIRQHRDRAEALLQASLPVMDRLAGGILDTGSSLLLADRHGLILEQRTRAADGELFGLAGLSVGADWSEAAEGTNAIGTCLADGRATVIWRDQHFFARNLPLICIGAPVEAADGSLAGVLNISSSREDLSDVQARLMALAIQDAAVQASTALFHTAFSGARIVTLGTEPGSGPSLLAVDRDDLVIGANRAARRALKLSAADLDDRQPLTDLMADLLGDSADRGADLDRALRSEVTRALHRAHGNVTRAAAALGISRATLYRKMKTLGIARRG